MTFLRFFFSQESHKTKKFCVQFIDFVHFILQKKKVVTQKTQREEFFCHLSTRSS
jgi:hypothetical protein